MNSQKSNKKTVKDETAVNFNCWSHLVFSRAFQSVRSKLYFSVFIGFQIRSKARLRSPWEYEKSDRS